MGHMELFGTLQPGESYIAMGYNKYVNSVKGVMDRADSLTQHNPKLAAIANQKYSVSTSAYHQFIVGRPYDILGSNWKYKLQSG